MHPVVFPGHTTWLSTLFTPHSSCHSRETKEVFSMWWLWCRVVLASLEHFNQKPIRMVWSCCQPPPSSLLFTRLLWSLVLAQWLLLIHVKCLVVASLALALFQPIVPGVNAGISAWLPKVLLQQFLHCFGLSDFTPTLTGQLNIHMDLWSAS